MMPNFQVVSHERHGHKGWLRYTSYAFAMRETVLPLTLAELPKAMMSLPIAFIEQAGVFQPVAVMGLQPAQNLFVAPDGRWVHGYVPAACRGYPFRIGHTPEGGQVLCVDEDSGLLVDAPDGEGFFAEDGKPAASLQQVIDFLLATEQSRTQTAAAVAVLQAKQLLKPLPLVLRSEAGDQAVAGLFQLDEEALNALSPDDLAAVRDVGGLVAAYCQLLSLQHLSVLGQLAEAQAKAAAAQVASAPALGADTLVAGDTLNFSGFR
ncbi:SapC family protein [Dechloromonas sp. ZY10]|uniref:SapC family protein n=1 Tax=Dechloromonas aquae TaxID=2664436 RepID=UPI003528CAAA